jgi:short-subunit dehydrogenase
MTHYFLRKFIERKETENRRSAIITLSSAAAHESTLRVPNCSLYAATKAFNRKFSLMMSDDYSKFIDVLTVCPRSVTSKVNNWGAPMTISSEQCGKAIVDQLGWFSETEGHFLHDIYGFVLSIWPIGSIVMFVTLKRFAKYSLQRAKEKPNKF